MASDTLDSKIDNLSISTIPNDNLNIVISKAKDYELTDRLKLLIAEANPDISQKAAPEGCPGAVSSSVPKYMLTQINELVTRNILGCYTESNGLATMCKGYISDTSSDFVDVTRRFWRQVDKCYDELNQKEKEINRNSAALRAITMPISSDCQTVASDELLALTLANENPNQLDSKFETSNELYIEPQPDSKQLIKEVLADNPQTVGVAGKIPPTNLVDVENGETVENIETVDLTPGRLVDDSKNGMLELFSNKFMNTPLDRIKELGGDPNNLTYQAFTSVTFLVPKNTPMAKFPDDVTTQTVNIYAQETSPTTGLNYSKSVLEQDWAVTTSSVHSEFFISKGIKHWVCSGRVVVNPVEYKRYVNEDVLIELRSRNLSFKGVMSRAKYNVDDVFALGAGLTALWNKLKNIKLPSVSQVQMGTNLLAAGLGAVGQLTGSAGLVNASGVLSSISDGLGVFVPTPPEKYPPRANAEDQTRACIYRHVNSIVPNLVQAGFEQCGKTTMSAQNLRQKLANESQAVMQGYMPSGEPPKISTYVQIRSKRRVRTA